MSLWFGKAKTSSRLAVSCSVRGHSLSAIATADVIVLTSGATNPLASAPGTIRGDYAIDVGRNICHGSDAVERYRSIRKRSRKVPYLHRFVFFQQRSKGNRSLVPRGLDAVLQDCRQLDLRVDLLAERAGGDEIRLDGMKFHAT